MENKTVIHVDPAKEEGEDGVAMSVATTDKDGKVIFTTIDSLITQAWQCGIEGCDKRGEVVLFAVHFTPKDPSFKTYRIPAVKVCKTHAEFAKKSHSFNLELVNWTEGKHGE
jgi:hypothetical protein